jgi:alpha-1,2-mannosyltransferase
MSAEKKMTAVSKTPDATAATSRAAKITNDLPMHMDTIHIWFLVFIVPIYISYRVYIAQYMPITDCDEVYNYWEPLHFMLYRSGHQTWEYDTVYALRTYAYLLPLQWMAQYIYQPLLSSSYYNPFSVVSSSITDLDPKLQLFMLLRGSIAGITACSELFWIHAMIQYNIRNSFRQQQSVSFAVTVPIITSFLLLTCTGMNHAAGALLPSATWISIWCVCAGCFLHEYHTLFVLAAIVGTLGTGWPFGCVCVIPMSIHILYKECWVHRNGVSFLISMIAITVFVQGIVSVIDAYHYGTMTFPTYNIFSYNAGGNGDELYGIEPTSYYIKNLILNCNLLVLFGSISLPIYWLSCSNNSIVRLWQQYTFYPFDANIVSLLLSLPAWLAITVPRPHKEERFMFPIYPVLVYGAVWTVDTVLTRILVYVRSLNVGIVSSSQSGVIQSNQIKKVTSLPTKIHFWRILGHTFVWIPVVLLSISRSMALHWYYKAPIDVYSALSSSSFSPAVPTPPQLVCTCGEWYRYPSSFFLPEMSLKIPVGFLRSSFTGQLPQPFTVYGSRKESHSLLQPFNDRNIEQPERYVSDISQCGWLIDLSDATDCMTLFPADQVRMTKITAVPFLDSERTTSTLHRTLFVPYRHEHARRSGRIVFKDYILYKIEHNIADKVDE